MLKVTDFGDCNDDSLKLESGPSSRFTAPRLISCRIDILIIFRIAAFNAYNNAFKIIDLMTRIPLLSVDMGQEVVDHLAQIYYPLFLSSVADIQNKKSIYNNRRALPCDDQASVSPMFSCWQLYDGNWIGGNFVFIKEVCLSL